MNVGRSTTISGPLSILGFRRGIQMRTSTDLYSCYKFMLSYILSVVFTDLSVCLCDVLQLSRLALTGTPMVCSTRCFWGFQHKDISEANPQFLSFPKLIRWLSTEFSLKILNIVKTFRQLHTDYAFKYRQIILFLVRIDLHCGI